MPRINPEGQLTRAERLATVIAVAAAVVVHLLVLVGWGRLSRWTQEEEKKERLMVIRRVRDLAPPPPVPSRPRPVPAGAEGAEGKAASEQAKPKPPEPEAKDQAPPQTERELSPGMEQELQEQQQQPPPDPAGKLEQGETSISVVTDLPSASFIIDGAAQYRGSGTFWVRKGAAPGRYTVTFNPVSGFATPPLQTKELDAKGQVVFVGKYRRSTEVVVDSNRPGAQFTVFGPDGKPLDLSRTGRALLDDLPPGAYTAVFKDLPGLITPAPVTQRLSPGGKLVFFGEYREAGGGGAGGVAGGSGGGTGTGYRGSGPGAGGSGSGSGRRSAGRGRGEGDAPAAKGLDPRVQMVVTSYPRTDIETDYTPIPYPEVVIRESNIQRQDWCQVYLIVSVGESGNVFKIEVERPRDSEQERFARLIAAVEGAVRSWVYDTVRAEVHVDARFYVE